MLATLAARVASHAAVCMYACILHHACMQPCRPCLTDIFTRAVTASSCASYTRSSRATPTAWPTWTRTCPTTPSTKCPSSRFPRTGSGSHTRLPFVCCSTPVARISRPSASWWHATYLTTRLSRVAMCWAAGRPAVASWYRFATFYLQCLPLLRVRAALSWRQTPSSAAPCTQADDDGLALHDVNRFSLLPLFLALPPLLAPRSGAGARRGALTAASPRQRPSTSATTR